jgi:molybdopterin synthase sulfur carrier subunit
VKVRLLGVFRWISKKSQITFEMMEPVTVRDVVCELSDHFSPEFRQELMDPELDDPRPNTLILVDGKEISALKGLDTRVKDDNEIILIPVLHGGQLPFTG